MVTVLSSTTPFTSDSRPDMMEFEGYQHGYYGQQYCSQVVGQYEQFGYYPGHSQEHDMSPKWSGSPVASADSPWTPDSQTSSEVTDVEVQFVHSPVFHPTAKWDVHPPDTILFSADCTLFHVHRARLLAFSKNTLAGLLPHLQPVGGPQTPQIVPVAEDAAVLCLVLSIAYGVQPDTQHAAFDTLCGVVSALKRYAMPTQPLLARHTPFADRLLAHAPLHALELYTLGAEHGVEHLAVSASAHLLSLSLLDLSDAQARRMGVRYLHRFFALQATRVRELHRLVLPPPALHPVMRSCTVADQQLTQRAWALAVAKLAWHMAPDMPVAVLQRVMAAVEAELTCPKCLAAHKKHVSGIVRRWSLLDRTI